MDNLKGNITTIITWICFLILPYFATYGITHEQLVALFTSIIGIIYAVYNSKHPNTFKCLGNHNEYESQIVTTDELSDAIKTASKEIETEQEETDDVVDEDDQQ